MRKMFMLFSICTFTLFSFFGYLIAAKGFTENKPVKVGYVGTGANTVQPNLLLVKVDRLDSKRPIPSSVWIGSVYHSPNQTVLAFSPLEDENTSINSERNKTTALVMNSDGSPGSDVYKAVENKGIKITGYLVVDEKGFEDLVNLYFEKDDTLSLRSYPNIPVFLEYSCRFIKDRAKHDAPDGKFVLRAFTPHLKTNVSLDELIPFLSSLSDPNHPTNCKIIL
jgi:hypothetical protein